MADSSSSSTSSSTSFPIQTPQSDWELQLSQILASLGQQQLGWAQGVFGQTSQVTDQMINQYTQDSAQALNLANTTLQQYENQTVPQMNNLVQDANTYASTPRIQEAMGAAESATGQAMDQGRINAEQTLQQYGIDPSSGRYQELEQAQQASKAAAQAGAGQQAELATEQTGRDLRNQAITFGQNQPAMTVNALNTGVNAVTGAEQANLGNANVGANVMNTVPPYFNAAMSLKYPPTGTTSSSQSSQQSSPSQPNSSGNSGNTSGRSSGNTSPGQLSSGDTQPYAQGEFDMSSGSSGQMGSGNFDPTTGMSIPDNSGSNFGAYAPTDNQSSNEPFSSAFPDAGYGTDQTSMQQDPFAAGQSNNFYDPYSAGGDQSNALGLPGADYNSPGTYGGDNSGSYTYDPSASGGDTSGGDSSYARGGGVMPGPTTGGHVPVQASPSMGRNTDDISARLNAGEFVVPRDVAAWKGQEYFQKLIEDSRRKRMGAPAKGKAKPALNGPPRFQSQQMGAQ